MRDEVLSEKLLKTLPLAWLRPDRQNAAEKAPTQPDGEKLLTQPDTQADREREPRDEIMDSQDEGPPKSNEGYNVDTDADGDQIMKTTGPEEGLQSESGSQGEEMDHLPLYNKRKRDDLSSDSEDEGSQAPSDMTTDSDNKRPRRKAKDTAFARILHGTLNSIHIFL